MDLYRIIEAYCEDDVHHYILEGTDVPSDMQYLCDKDLGVFELTTDVAEAEFSLFRIDLTDELVIMPITIDGPYQLDEPDVTELGFLKPHTN